MAEQFGAFKQGVEYEQPAVGMPPQGLLRGVGGGELGDAGADLGGDEVEEVGCAAVLPPCGERVGHGFAVWVGWGVVVGAAGGVKALLGRVTDEYEHGRLAVAAEGLWGEQF